MDGLEAELEQAELDLEMARALSEKKGRALNAANQVAGEARTELRVATEACRDDPAPEDEEAARNDLARSLEERSEKFETAKSDLSEMRILRRT